MAAASTGATDAPSMTRVFVCDLGTTDFAETIYRAASIANDA
jgi:hypothetical protein